MMYRYFLAPTRHDSDPETGKAINGSPADATGAQVMFPGCSIAYDATETQCVVRVQARFAPTRLPRGWTEIEEEQAAATCEAWRGRTQWGG